MITPRRWREGQTIACTRASRFLKQRQLPPPRDAGRSDHMQYSIRLLMCLMLGVAVGLFLWKHATPVAFLLLALVPTLLFVLERRKVRSRLHSPMTWSWILLAATCAYVGSIGPFNMLLGCLIHDNHTLMRVNDLGRWVYAPMRSLPAPVRYRLDVNYISGWRNYGTQFADPDDLGRSFPTQLY